jgi:hypothetical protein
MPESALLVTAMLTGIGCYADESLASLDARLLTSVVLTDAPFPYDFVESVKVYVTEVAASTESDATLGSSEWATIARPRQYFELLALQGGNTALVGQGELPPSEYRAIRMTINGDSSSVTFANGAAANVRWPNGGDIPLYPLVEQPIELAGTAVEIVIDFDVGRSFVYGLLDPLHDFAFVPALRAVNRDLTGTLTGTVLGDANGDLVPEAIEDATISVLSGNPSGLWVSATGRTAADGSYAVRFLLQGTYVVQVEAPGATELGSDTTLGINIVAGAETTHSVTLPSS